MTDQSIPPWLREEAEKLDAKIRLAIAAVRCDSSTPTGSFADAIAAFALRVSERLAQEKQEACVPARASEKHHLACDPGWGPRNYRCHPECIVGKAREEERPR